MISLISIYLISHVWVDFIDAKIVEARCENNFDNLIVNEC